MAVVKNVKATSGGEEKTTTHGKSIADRLKEDATRIERERDIAGRLIGVQQLDFIDAHNLTKLMGEDARNEVAINQAMVVASVIEIDGESVSRPRTPRELEALMRRLSWHGVAAAKKALEKFEPVMTEGEAEEIKN